MCETENSACVDAGLYVSYRAGTLWSKKKMSENTQLCKSTVASLSL